MTEFNPLWIVVVLGVGGALVTIARWTANVDAARKGWERVAKTIDDKLDTIQSRIDDLFTVFGRQAVRAESPVRLTEFGQELSKKLNATAWAVRTADSVQGEVEDKEAWEIHDFCFAYSKERLSKDRERDVKRVAYEAGVDDVQARNVLAVELRDQLLNLLRLDAPE